MTAAVLYYSTVHSKLFSRTSLNRRAGLSLIETLVVATILLLLLVVLGGRQTMLQLFKGEDARRKSDLDTIKIAFEGYYNDYGCYPPPCALSTCTEELNSYIRQEVPRDPRSNQPYVYVAHPIYNSTECADRTDGFQVFTVLNNTADPDIAELDCEGGCGLTQEVAAAAGSTEPPELYTYGVSEGVAVSSVATSSCDSPCTSYAQNFCITSGGQCDDSTLGAENRCPVIAQNPPCGCPYSSYALCAVNL